MSEFTKPAPKFPNKFLKENPLFLKQKQDDSEMDEEEYLDKIGEIIKRDFFPDLQKIQNLYRNLDTGTSKLNEEEGKFSLNQFLSRYNSEDNNSFKRLLEKDQENWKEKYWWIFKGEDSQKKLKALQDDSEISENRKKHMLKNEPLLKICDVEGQTNLMFMAQTYDGKVSSVDEKDKEPDFRKVISENTRLDNPTSNYIDTIAQGSQSSQKLALIYGQTGGIYTPDLLGYKRREELMNEGPIELSKLQEGKGESPIRGQAVGAINGYKLLTLPSPTPSEMKSPLITWGEIASAPLRVEGEGKAAYRIPAKPRKEILGAKLVDNMTKKKKMSKNSQKEKYLKNRSFP